MNYEDNLPANFFNLADDALYVPAAGETDDWGDDGEGE